MPAKIMSVEMTSKRRASRHGAFTVQIIGPNRIIYPMTDCLRDLPEKDIFSFRFETAPKAIVEGWCTCTATVRTRSEVDALAASVAGFPKDGDDAIAVMVTT